MNGLAKVKCVSGDCEEMIYYPFWKRHGGYCTKHPEKWPKIKMEDGSGRKQDAKTTYYKKPKKILDRIITNLKSKKKWANPFI